MKLFGTILPALFAAQVLALPAVEGVLGEKREAADVNSTLGTIVYIGGLKDKRDAGTDISKRDPKDATVDSTLGTIVYIGGLKDKRSAKVETIDSTLGTIVYIGGLKDKREAVEEVERAVIHDKEKREAAGETVDSTLGTIVYIGGLKE